MHMNPEYIVLGGLLWKSWGKTVALWYAHKKVSLILRLAEQFTDVVFTSTTSGFRLPSKKVKVIGQGIDTDKFKVPGEKYKVEEKIFRIVTVGRISPSKDYDTLIDAVALLSLKQSSIRVDIFGPTSFVSDEVYLARLKEKIAQKKLTSVISFRGPIANTELPLELGKADLFVNMGHTGSMDKAVPEAMACGLPILTCNEAFVEVLGEYASQLMYPKGDARVFADKIEMIAKLSPEDRQRIGAQLREIVVTKHSLRRFVSVIVEMFTELSK